MLNSICAQILFWIQIGVMQKKVGDLSFSSFSTEDWEMVTEALTSLKNTPDEAHDRAAR
jgi:hypothetical protein